MKITSFWILRRNHHKYTNRKGYIFRICTAYSGTESIAWYVPFCLVMGFDDFHLRAETVAGNELQEMGLNCAVLASFLQVSAIEE